MSFDYSAAKAAIQKAGHTVSNGPHVIATDIREIVKYGRRVFGLSEVAVKKGIANPAILPEGFPGKTATVVETAPVAESAPEVIEPVQDATPDTVEDAPKSKKAKKSDEPAAQ